MNDLSALIEAYARHEARRKRRPRGLAGYLDVLRQLRRYADGRTLSAELVGDWFGARAAVVSTTTLAYARTVVASFAAFLRAEGHTGEDLLAKVPRYRKRRRQPIQAKRADVRAIDTWLRAPAADPHERRDQRFVGICLYAGLRISEACALTWRAVDLEGGELVVICGKGGDDRVVTIAPPLRRLLDAVPPERRVGAVAGRADGRPLKRQSAAHIYERAIPRYLGVRISAHALRRAFATRMDELGTSVRVIQDLLGHRSLETTQRYLGVDGERRRRATEGLEAGW